MENKIKSPFLVISTNSWSWILLIVGTAFWALALILHNFIFMVPAAVCTFSSIMLGYEKNQTTTIAFLVFSVLLIFIPLWYVEQQPVYLSVAMTAVMAILTTWYSARNLKLQTDIVQKSARKNYIAEVSRSIFSAMQNDLHKVKNDIKYSPIRSIVHPSLMFDHIDPISYIEGNVEIRGVPAYFEMPNGRGYSENYIGPSRPAKLLLTGTDGILKEKYLPVITELCKNYRDENIKLKTSMNSLVDKFPAIFSDFEKYCSTLASENIRTVLKFHLGDAKQETYYHYLLRYALIPDAPGREYSWIMEDGGIRTIDYKDEFEKFLLANRSAILEWLLQSEAKDEIISIQESFNRMKQLIDQIDVKINELLLEWKVEYGLTEYEMHLKPFSLF